MNRGVIDVLDGTYFVFFEEVLSGGMTCVIRTFDAIEVADAVRTSDATGMSNMVVTPGTVRTSGVITTSGVIGASDAIRTSGAIGASDAIRTSGTVGTSNAIRMSGGAVEGPVDAVVTGGSTDAGAGASVDSGFCATGEESDVFTEAEAMCGCSKAIVTVVLVGKGSGRTIEEISGAAATAVIDSDIDGITRG
jgi:hypothetical protein